MAALELALVLLATVIASAVIDQLLPHVPLPLIQIGSGLLVALLAEGRITITLNPDLFLVLFIAPLLFREARDADKLSLWHNRVSMLSYAIGLVVAIVLVVGFMLNWLAPSIPLAAAFALGAALGPTDPIAVASVSKRADIPARQQTTLQGESLLNDASGIVSFQFAVSAIVTGYFSVLDAVGAFAFSFFGALAVGVILGFVFAKVADWLRDLGLENTTFHVLLELLAPFIAYLLGEFLGVSGVILVVACGITMSLAPRSLGPSAARMNIVSASVWKVVEFALNGVVFVMLGTQLPQAFGDAWADSGISNYDLIFYVFAITLVMHGMRFMWALVSEAREFRKRGERPELAKRLRSAATMTFAGSKGAITLAIMFSLPMYVDANAMDPFPQRELLIFLACGVILVSLVLATIAVPLLAPRKKEDPTEMRQRDSEACADIFRAVIEELTARQTRKNRATIGPVIALYNERLERYKEKQDLEDESDIELRLMVLDWEQEYVLDLVEADEVPPMEGYQYVSRVARVSRMMRRDARKRLRFLKWWRRSSTTVRKMGTKLRRRLPGDYEPSPESTTRIMRDIQARADEHVVKRLKELMPESDIQSEKISQLIGEYERSLLLLRGPGPSVTAFTRQVDPDLDAMRLGLRIELDQIQQAYEDGRISRASAQQMRKNVYLMQIDLDDYV
ncbi:MAG: sodium:proton antiporter [Eggerthellaceae bacterium]|nr:sodium:proton antiporter [Eggerthellaceae bacterium]